MRSSCVTYLQLGRFVSVSQLGRLVSVSSDISARYGRTTREKMRLGMIHLRGRLVWVDLFKGRLRWLPYLGLEKVVSFWNIGTIWPFRFSFAKNNCPEITWNEWCYLDKVSLFRSALELY